MSKWKSSDINRLENQGTKVQGWKAQPALPFPGEPIKKQRKPKSNEESILQQACMKLFSLMYPQINPKKYYAIPNGGKRDQATAIVMMREGQRPGVWDTFLKIARHEHHGMYIEFKIGRNGLTDHQQEFQRCAEEEGYKCVVVHTTDEFIGAMEAYLGKSKLADTFRKR